MSIEPRQAETEIADLNVRAELRFLPAALTFVRSVAAEAGLADRGVRELELAVEECMLNVVQHAFEPHEQGHVHVTVGRRPGQIVVGVEDQGLPYDLQEAGSEEPQGLGTILMKAAADELRFINRGKAGKRVEVVKNLACVEPETDAAIATAGGEPAAAVNEVETAGADVPVEIRLMRSEEASKLARCVYRSYGYSYITDHLYFPDKVRELLEAGRMVSCVAVVPDGEIVGHLALVFERRGAAVAESGQAVVDPRFRGRGLFKQLKNFAAEQARQRGVLGLFSESVTIHPYTQKGNLSIGAREIGFLLGYIPPSLYFKKIQREDQTQRQTSALFYLKTGEEPSRNVHLPERHAAVLQKIYEANNLRRERAVGGEKERETPHRSAELPQRVRATVGGGEHQGSAESVLDLTVRPEWGHGVLRVGAYGNDVVSRTKARLQELCARRIDCIYLDLPLADSRTPVFCTEFEELGFFFAGILPEMANGDILRLQYLNNVPIDPDEIHVASSLGQRLLDYVMAERARVQGA